MNYVNMSSTLQSAFTLTLKRDITNIKNVLRLIFHVGILQWFLMKVTCAQGHTFFSVSDLFYCNVQCDVPEVIMTKLWTTICDMIISQLSTGANLSQSKFLMVLLIKTWAPGHPTHLPQQNKILFYQLQPQI